MTHTEKLILQTLHTNSRMLQAILMRARLGTAADVIDSKRKEHESTMHVSACFNEDRIAALLERDK